MEKGGSDQSTHYSIEIGYSPNKPLKHVQSKTNLECKLDTLR